MAGEQDPRYVGARGALDLVMPGPRPPPPTDPIVRENPPYSLADRVLPGRTPAVEIGVTRAREHVGQNDTRYQERVRQLLDQDQAQSAADRLEAMGSEGSAEKLYASGSELQSALVDIANVLRGLPGYKSAIEANDKRVQEMETRFSRLEGTLTSTLIELEKYRKTGEDEVKKQRGVFDKKVDDLTHQMTAVRTGVQKNEVETFKYLGYVRTQFEGLTGAVKQFMENVTKLSRETPNALERRLDDIQERMENRYSVSSLAPVIETALLSVAQKKVKLLDMGFETLSTITSFERLADLEKTAGKIAEGLKKLEALYPVIEKIQQEIAGMKTDFNSGYGAFVEGVSEMGTDIAGAVTFGFKETRQTAVRAIARADNHSKRGFRDAYKRLDGIKGRVESMKAEIVQAVEQSVQKVMENYVGRPFTPEQCDQIGGVMVGAIINSHDNLPESFYRKLEASITGKFGDTFKGFAALIGKGGVKMNPDDRKAILDAINGDGGLSGRVVKVEKALEALERRLPTDDLVTEKGVRKIIGEEVQKGIKGLEPTIKGYIDLTAEKIAASRPKREPRPTGERRATKPREEKVASPKSLIAGFTQRFKKK